MGIDLRFTSLTKTAADTFRNGINQRFANLTGIAAGRINPNVTIIVQHTGPSTNIPGGIIIAYRRASGPNTVPGAIDRSTAVAIQDTSSGDTIIRWYGKRTTITAAPKVMLHRKTSFKLPPLFRTAVSRSLSG